MSNYGSPSTPTYGTVSEGKRESAIPVAVGRLGATAELTLKAAHMLADRLAPVLRAEADAVAKDMPMPNPNGAGVPLALQLDGIHRNMTELAAIVDSLSRRLEL